MSQEDDPMLRRKCKGCGRFGWGMTAKSREAWAKRDYAPDQCERCVAKFRGPAPRNRNPKCGGCGKSKPSNALTAGVCKKCAKGGLSAPTLFGGDVA